MNCFNSFFSQKSLKKNSVQLSEQKLQNTSECTQNHLSNKSVTLDIEQQLSEKLMDDSNAKVKRMTYRFVSTQCQCSVSQCMFCLSASCKSGNNSTGLRNETLGSIMYWNCSCKKKKKKSKTIYKSSVNFLLQSLSQPLASAIPTSGPTVLCCHLKSSFWGGNPHNWFQISHLCQFCIGGKDIYCDKGPES